MLSYRPVRQVVNSSLSVAGLIFPHTPVYIRLDLRGFTIQFLQSAKLFDQVMFVDVIGLYTNETFSLFTQGNYR